MALCFVRTISFPHLLRSQPRDAHTQKPAGAILASCSCLDPRAYLRLTLPSAASQRRAAPSSPCRKPLPSAAGCSRCAANFASRPIRLPASSCTSVCLGASLFLPVVDGWFSYGTANLEEMTGLGSLLGLGIINFSDAAIYAARIPGRDKIRFDRPKPIILGCINWCLACVGGLVRLLRLLRVMDAWDRVGGNVSGYAKACGNNGKQRHFRGAHAWQSE